jgi:hypothetical protein
MFPGELYWRQDEFCSGLKVSQTPECNYRISEMQLLMYTPLACINGEVPNCDELVAYSRIGVYISS